MSERTLVGIPFYESEGQDCLDITLRNVDQCLGKLGVDASVLVQVNGPETVKGNKPDLRVNTSLYNAELELRYGDGLSQPRAVDTILQVASLRGLRRVFITDADIFRFYDSFTNMWHTPEKAIVGARYRPYPIDIVEAEFGKLSHDERVLYQIFDGDQLPQVRHTLLRRGIDRESRVKGSLMLVNVEKCLNMHDGQTHAADSVMNRVIGSEETCTASDAHFMHMGRIDMGDHIKARMRHFRAADKRGELESFVHKEVRLPNAETMDAIAEDVRSSYINGDYYAMLYLCRCAVRQQVNEICSQIVQGTWDEKTAFDQQNMMSLMDVRTYDDACRAASRFFVNVDWNDIRGFGVTSTPTTQEKLRRPFDVGRHMADFGLAKLAIASFMLEEPVNLRSHRVAFART